MNNTKKYSEEDIINLLGHIARCYELLPFTEQFMGPGGERYEPDDVFKLWSHSHAPSLPSLPNHLELLRIAKQESEFRYPEDPDSAPLHSSMQLQKRKGFLDGILWLAAQKSGTITPKNESPEY